MQDFDKILMSPLPWYLWSTCSDEQKSGNKNQGTKIREQKSGNKNQGTKIREQKLRTAAAQSRS
jgi:hypothetical protein